MVTHLRSVVTRGRGADLRAVEGEVPKGVAGACCTMGTGPTALCEALGLPLSSQALLTRGTLVLGPITLFAHGGLSVLTVHRRDLSYQTG